MPKAIIELTTQQLVDALGIDVTAVHEVSQDLNDRLSGRLRLVVDAEWASPTPFGAPCGFPPACYPLEDVPLRINPQAKE